MSKGKPSDTPPKNISSVSDQPDSNSSALTCIVTDGKDCEKCELDKVLQCKFTKREIIRFIIVNTCHRVSVLALFFFIGFMLNTWWMMWAYGLFVALTFFVIEPLLICSHCPFYAQEGKFLQCGGLWGIPKFWKYHSEPIKKWSKTIMLVVGGIFEVIPFLGIVGGVILFLNDPQPYMIYGIGLIFASFIVIGLGYYTLKTLLGDRCKRCPNFSCPLNKVPADYVHLFLMKNIPMREAWKEAGWHLESV